MFLRYEDVQILVDQTGKSRTTPTMGCIVNAYKILVETSELKTSELKRPLLRTEE